jgi:hypothetical protein
MQEVAMKTKLLLCFLISSFAFGANANGGPASVEGPRRGTAATDEESLDSKARGAESKSRSTREAAQENQRNGSFPGSFGTVDQREEEMVPEESRDFEGIKDDPYIQVEE